MDGLKFGNRIGRTWVGLPERSRERPISRMVPSSWLKHLASPPGATWHLPPWGPDPIKPWLSPGGEDGEPVLAQQEGELTQA